MSLSTNGFTLFGSTFTGWNTNPGGTGTPYGSTYDFTADLQLHA